MNKLNFRILNLFIIFCISISLCKSQSSFPDSVNNKLKLLTDSAKVVQLQEWAWKLRYNQPKIALNYIEEALKLSVKLNDKNLEATSINYTGVIYLHLSDFSTAIDYFFKALKISEDNNLVEQIGYSFNNIGHVYRYRRDLPQALKYINKALDYQKKANNPRGIAYSYVRLSEVYNLMKIHDSAFFYAKSAYDIRKNLNDNEGMRVATITLAESLEYLGKYGEALKNYLDVIEYAPKPARTYNQIARTYLKLDIIDSALVYGYLSYNKAKNDDEYQIAFDASVTLSQIFAKSGNYTKSYNFLVQSLDLKDSMFNEEKNRQILQLDIAYDSKKKTQDNLKLQAEARTNNILLISILIGLGLLIIVLFILNRSRRIEKTNNKLLKEKNEEIHLQADQLTELNAMKDKFFSILAHDLKNPIGNFREMTNILYTNFDHFDDTEKREFLDLMHKSSSQVYNLLINLLDWSKSQQGKIVFHPESNYIYLITENVISSLHSIASNKNIELVNQTIKDMMVYVDVNMVTTVIRNLVSNSIKFTHPNGKIIIGAEIYKSDFIRISVNDNGVGMDSSLINKLFRIDTNVTNKGTSNETGTGLGLLLSKEFIDKHSGEIWVESEVGIGTTFYFTIPIKK